MSSKTEYEELLDIIKDKDESNEELIEQFGKVYSSIFSSKKNTNNIQDIITQDELTPAKRNKKKTVSHIKLIK